MPYPEQSRDSCLPDINLKEPRLFILLDIDIYWEMSIYVAHFVLEPSGDSNDQVVNESFDGPESSDILSSAVVKFDDDGVLAAL